MTKKYLRFFLIINIIFLFTFLGGVSVSADNFFIEYDKEGGKLIENTDDLFQGIDNMMPGDEINQTINIKNSSLFSKELKIYVLFPESLTEKQSLLLDSIDIDINDIKASGTTSLYSGKLSGLASIKENPNILETDITSFESRKLEVKIALPSSADNSISSLSLPLIWRFYVKDAALKTADPVITPPGATYNDYVEATITCPTQGAVIHYTTDGTEPDESSPVYKGILKIEKNTVLKAMAVKESFEPSSTVDEEYKIKVSAPVITPPGATYNDYVEATITCPTQGAVIHYTTDGTEPDESSPVYNKTFQIDKNTIIKAIGTKDNCISSDISKEEYKIKVSAPIITPPGKTYDEGVSATITCPTQGAVIHYTTDGTDPDESSPIYDKTIQIDKNTIIKAIGTKNNCISSDISTEEYKIKIPAPVITPSGDIYSDQVNVIISSSVPDTIIHYTTDGTDPNENSPIYKDPLKIDVNTVVKAISTKNGCIPSDIVKEEYKIKLSSPVITPPGGTYTNSVDVFISSSPDVIIHYTTDGTEPDENSPVYKDSLKIDVNAVVKAISTKNGCIPSDVVKEEYIINIPVIPDSPVPEKKEKVATPVITPEGGEYISSVKVKIKCSTPDAVIHYTTDGSIPTENDPIYKSPIEISKTSTVSAVAFKEGFDSSDTASERYKIKAATPDITPPGGTYNTPQTVYITCDTPGVVIYYTTDGTYPDENSPVYINPIFVDKSSTVIAIACKPGVIPSDPASETYYIVSVIEQVAKPYAVPPGGIYNNKISVALHCSTPGADIYFTLDGSDPCINGKKYIYDEIEIVEDTVIRAYAKKEGMLDSPSITEEYIINIPVESKPVIPPSIIKTGVDLFKETKELYVPVVCILCLAVFICVIISVFKKNKKSKKK